MQDNITISAFELLDKFPNAESARIHLERIRWNGAVKCPNCGSANIYARKGNRFGFYDCRDCKTSQFSVRTGTIFEQSPIPLHKWIYAIYKLMTARKGVSSLQLSKEISVTQKSTWYMLHRLRIACGGDFEALRGLVEMDTTYIGGKESNKHESKKLKQGRGTVGKQPVIGMKERGGSVKAVAVDAENKDAVLGLLDENVEKGSTIYSDEAKAYDSVGKKGYKHGRVNHSAKEFVNGMASTNGVESVWAVLKRGYHGTYHNWSAKHCQKYVNEFVFRLNKGNCKVPTMDRIDSLIKESMGKTVTYRELVS